MYSSFLPSSGHLCIFNNYFVWTLYVLLSTCHHLLARLLFEFKSCTFNFLLLNKWHFSGWTLLFLLVTDPLILMCFPQSPQRSPWHQPMLMLKLVRTPWCSAVHHMTPLWTSPLSGLWMAGSLTFTGRVNIMNAPWWDILLIISLF